MRAYPYCGAFEMCRSGITGLCPNGALFEAARAGVIWREVSRILRVPLSDTPLIISPAMKRKKSLFRGRHACDRILWRAKLQFKTDQTVAIIGAGRWPVCVTTHGCTALPGYFGRRRANRLKAALRWERLIHR
jgi:threonine dehydrogenase-like Zn-dependent dehydrogenase